MDRRRFASNDPRPLSFGGEAIDPPLPEQKFEMVKANLNGKWSCG